ncbi:MAG: ABC transporter substrate-binding protein [Oscillospiraceae bacterium]|jgi:iron complex transport system substrate-binding protein|nr:ABC transporter substrate-binding protein [Oscillospiraceae bacterium]
MKKTLQRTLFPALLALLALLALAACSSDAPPADTPTPTPTETVEEATPANVEEPSDVTITDFDGRSVTLTPNPARVAIYDYAILDILYNIGFENTGIQQLIVPSKDTLPDALEYYKNQGDDKVLTGGTLFYVDWDVLDLVQPELVILGGRSFGMNASGERLGREENEKFRTDTEERYNQTVFAKLSVGAGDAALLTDMERNIAALSAIFPAASDELEAKFEEIKSEIAAIHAKVEASGKNALFAMMVDQTTLSVFLPSSRFDMLYEEFGFASAASEAVEWTDQHGFDVRAEYVLEVDPDVIFLLDRSATVGTGAGAENFINDPIIARTRAAVAGDIYVLTGDAWYTMTGGFSAAEAMISDISQYIEKLD